MKKTKFWTILGVLALSITCTLGYVNTSKASIGLQSNGQFVYDDPSTPETDVVLDAEDHTLLKNNIDANAIDINSLKQFKTTQEALNQQLQDNDAELSDKDAQLEGEINTLNDSLGIDIKLINGVPNWSERGADTWSPFSGKPIDLGTATSFDVSSYPNYDSFTVDSFLINTFEQGSANASVSIGTDQPEYGYSSVSLVKSYDASTGVLTAYIQLNVQTRNSTFGGMHSAVTTKKIPVNVYLIK